jgi:hypothetical protein
MRVTSFIDGSVRQKNGEQIVVTLSRQLAAEFGNGYSRPNLLRMIRFAELFADYATASRANVRNSREGSGCSSRQVMLTGRLPLCLRNRIKRLEVLEVFVIVCNDGDEALTQAKGRAQASLRLQRLAH